MAERVVVALGGNALVTGGDESLAAQRATLERALEGVSELALAGRELLLTHGNGPQVGHALLRAERARGEAYDLPLEVCVAQSQGEIGLLIADTLAALLARRGARRDVCAVVTRVLVDADDPRMRSPSKPIGPYYDEARATELRASGWTIEDDAGRGFRRRVPSPLPLRVIEAAPIRALFDAGVIVVAGGGGGVPVCDVGGELHGVAAVVDKDHTAALLAELIGARDLLFLTSVPFASLDRGTPRERPIRAVSVAELERALSDRHFAPGSMQPKIEAALRFVRGDPARRAIIAEPPATLEALAGRAGTVVTA